MTSRSARFSVNGSHNPGCNVVVLTLPRAAERQTRISQLLADAKIPFEFFDGVDGLSSNPIRDHYSPMLRSLTKGSPLSPGQLGCFASHYQIWKKSVSENKALIVLEDDVTFSAHLLHNFLQSIEQPPEGPLCIRLFENRTKNHRSIVCGTLGSFTLFRYTKGPMSAMGYYINPEAASLFIKHSFPVFLPVDIYMDRYWKHRVPCLGTSPGIVEHDYAFESTIGYPGSKTRRTLLQKMLRETFALSERLRRFAYNAQRPRWRRVDRL